MTIRMRATYDETWRESADDDAETLTAGGYTDPSNPWGGFRYEKPDGLVGEAFVVWQAENAEVVEFDTVEEAAQFVADFPGAVWDLWPDCDESTNGDDRSMRVVLHVLDQAPAVHALARQIQDATDADLKARRFRSAW